MPPPAAPDRWTTAMTEGPWARLVPWLALFVRSSVGLALLNFGMIQVIGSGQGIQNPPAEMGALLLWSLLQSLPYAAIAIGLGLVCGIFTTLNALLTCGLTLAFPVVVLVSLVAQSMSGPTGPGFARNPYSMFGPSGGEGLILVSFAVVIMPCLVLLVLLSPMQINRYSLDTLMFRIPKRLTPPGTAPNPPRPTSPSFDLGKPDEDASA